MSASDFASPWVKCPLICVRPLLIAPFSTVGSDFTTPSRTTAMALQPAVRLPVQELGSTPRHALSVRVAQSLVPRELKSSATLHAPSWSTVALAEEMSRPDVPAGARTNFVFPSSLHPS